MKKRIQNYAKVGLVHHLLYPRCTMDAQYHADTLKEFIKRTDIEALDCCLPYDPKLREELIPLVRNCGKDVGYALHLFPSRKISLASTDIQEQAITKILMEDQINMAAAVGATGFVFVSGADVPDARVEAQAAFHRFCQWFCSKLEEYNIDALLEPFDREIDKKYLYGPIDDCVALVKMLREEQHDNMAIELDMAHLPLMFEDFASSIARCAPYMNRVHLGNCVLRDRLHPLYGDNHPPMGLEGGEIGKSELVVILQNLLDCGYLSETNRKPLILEMQPFPNKSVEYTIECSMDLLNQAWEAVEVYE